MIRTFTFTGNDPMADKAHQGATTRLNRFLTMTGLPRELLVGPIQQTVTVLHVGGVGIQWHVALLLTVAVPAGDPELEELYLDTLSSADTSINPGGL